MTEVPDVYPDFPDDEDSGESDDQGVEGRLADEADSWAHGDVVRTGDARVDAVLDSLTGLDDRHVREHAAVFERAHEELRAALEPDRAPA
jgi:hypothetical protein